MSTETNENAEWSLAECRLELEEARAVIAKYARINRDLEREIAEGREKRATCVRCRREFLFAGSIKSVPDNLCLDCFSEIYE